MDTKLLSRRLLIASITAAFFIQTPAVYSADMSPQDNQPNSKLLVPLITTLLTSVATNTLQQVVGEKLGLQPQGAQANFSGQGAASNQFNQQGGAPCAFNQSGGGRLSQVLIHQLNQAGCVMATQVIAQAPSALVSQFVTPTASPTMPVPQLSYNNAGVANVQGAKVTVVLIDPSGREIGQRPISQPFYSGEKFRLKIQPTFAGILEIDHIGPSGQRAALFPKQGMENFLLAPGREITLPLGNNVYEFDVERGTERLIFKIRDPRINYPNQFGSPVMTHDMGQSTFYGQQIPEGQLPYIAQAVDIQHR